VGSQGGDLMVKVSDIEEGMRVEACGLEGVDDGAVGQVEFGKTIGYFVWFGSHVRVLEAFRVGDEYLGIKQAD
jgi:hypothetical protein